MALLLLPLLLLLLLLKEFRVWPLSRTLDIVNAHVCAFQTLAESI